MPDENTLKAIGIRTLPAWYVAAHPQKARERGFGKVNASGSRLWGARRNHFPATTFTPSQMPFRRQPPVFDQSPAVGFPGKLSATFFAAPAGFSSNFTPPPIGSHFDQHPVLNRVQELPDQSYPQYHSSARGHGKELQIMRKPPKPKTPGYNTFAFQLPPLPSSPDSATAPAVEKPQTKHAPVWGPRPSKLAKGFAHRTQNPKSTRNEDDAAAQGLVPAASNLSQDINNLHVSAPSASNGQITKSTAEPNSSHYPSLSQSAVHCATLDAPSNSRSPAINSSFPSLIPSPPPEAKAVTQPSHDRKASICSDLFALAPKTPSPPHRRLFVSPGGERYVTAAEEPQAVSRESPELKKGVASSRYQERPQKSSHKGRQPARTKADCLKNLLDCDRKQRGVSPEKAPRKKRAVKEHAQKNELLVEIE